MKYTCPICKMDSESVDGPEVWGRECGFFEVLRPHPGGSSGYVVCSKSCAAILLKQLMSAAPEVPAFGTSSRTWKCETCGRALPQHRYQDQSALAEIVPSEVPRLVYPYSSDYHCFCSDACLLANLVEAEIVTTTA